MRLGKGEKVEVMNRKDSPVSWHVANILSCNGHNYHVQYDSCPVMPNQQMVETVPRKFVRPCPPTVQGLENCGVGDIVEVFHEYAWKNAVILKTLEGKKQVKSKKIPLQVVSALRKQFYVRLLGNSQEFIADGSNIRMRHAWQDGNWILIGKNSRVTEEIVASKPSTSNCYQKTNFQTQQFNRRPRNVPQTNCTNSKDESAFGKSHIISSRSQKRMSPYCSSVVEMHHCRAQKLRVLEKDGEKQRRVAGPILEKVDAVAYPKEYLGEKNMHASFKIASFNQEQRAKLTDNVGAKNSGNSSDSDACSVGSCSITDQNPNNFQIPFALQPFRETDALCSDAESCYGSGSERSSSLPPKEEVEISIRRLELHAYRRTLEALYASGSLSWEQEALLTNLRIMLHITNDEHLMELKNLISAKTAENVR
ncbi:uncharacterized protein LOC127265734 [Andrographis paniculata]|uniref:uncharacterized protein LOC127265734 n=1 Tax=Andrographis paniculata TaxID=175694 RepID=UPI0021E9A0C6|nr:uncharacterized protein LOC127265734 [Andrographis paniculata]XP_051151655.1 uncharacterized protein LOC127265734 [Andrographis paniculata]